MAFWMAIPAVISAGAAIYGAVSSSKNSLNNAQAAQAAALQNSINVRNTGMTNAALAGMAGQFNARNQMAAARISAESSLMVNAYNTALIRSVVDYNVGLLESELPALLSQWELSDMQLDQQRARSTGAIIATQSASGVVIGEGSAADVVIENEAQFALDALVLRHNYDQQSSDVLNSISRSQWEGRVSIAKMNFEAEVGAFNTMAQGRLNAAGIMANTVLSMYGTRYNAGQQASTIMSQGSAQYQQGMNTASQQLTAGVISGIGNAAAAYAAGSGGGTGSSLRGGSYTPATHAVNYTPPNYGQIGTSLIA